MKFSLDKAIAYVRQHGTPVELARLARALGERAAIDEAAQAVAALQNPDGGWPYQQEAGQPSSLAATHHTLTWLAELGLGQSPLAQGGLNFLLARQQPDGTWRESDQIAALDPPLWMSPDNDLANAYLSADSAYHLAVGLSQELEAVINACNSLYQLDLESQYPQTIWSLGALFTLVEGPDSEVARAARDYLGQRLDKHWDASALAWLLNTYLNAGSSPSLPLLAQARGLLERAQRADGSFGSQDGKEFVLDATIQAVRALQAAGVA